MNNRFKFRVWDKYYNNYWTNEEVKNNIEWLLYPDNENIEDVIIEQCTGLRDKNGKLIYEGNIVENENGKIFVIEWCQDKLGYVARTNNPEETLESLDISWDCWKIIGNIHENPEFLNADNA